MQSHCITFAAAAEETFFLAEFCTMTLQLQLVPGLAPSRRHRGNWVITENSIQKGEMEKKNEEKTSGGSTQLYRFATYVSPVM